MVVCVEDMCDVMSYSSSKFGCGVDVCRHNSAGRFVASQQRLQTFRLAVIPFLSGNMLDDQ